MKRWFRRTLRRYGIDLPFTGVVCPEHVKSIRVDANAGIEVTVRRTLVFLDRPIPGDLRDVIPNRPGAGVVMYQSPDAEELGRTSTPDATTVHWMPREPVVPYALSVHQYGWRAAGVPGEAALYTEVRCTARTGTVRLEISAPERFEAAVAFKRPRWRRMGSEARLVKYALRQLESGAERPALLDEGFRLEWTLAGPRVGDRYVCVAFQEDGVALWQRRLEANSLSSKVRRLLKPLAWAGGP